MNDRRANSDIKIEMTKLYVILFNVLEHLYKIGKLIRKNEVSKVAKK